VAFRGKLLAFLLSFQSGYFSWPLEPFWLLMKKFVFCSEMCLLHLHVLTLSVLEACSLATLVDLLSKNIQPKLNIQLVLF